MNREGCAEELILQRGTSFSDLLSSLKKSLFHVARAPGTPLIIGSERTALHAGDHLAITRRAFAEWNRVCSPREFAHGRLYERATRSVLA